MEDIAGWIAPIATALAAMMTAANLGPRFTGYGFVVFLVGSIAWSTVGYFSDQPNLLYQNIFLCAVNGIGIWRWLGREARYDSGAQAAARSSREGAGAALFPVSRLSGTAIEGRDGQTIARAIDAMAECATGRIRYLVVSEGGVGGVGERLHVLPFADLAIEGDALRTQVPAERIAASAEIAADDWPCHAQPDGR